MKLRNFYHLLLISVFLICNNVVHGQVTYTLGNTDYYTAYKSGGDIFANSGTSELGMWAHNDSKQVVAWRNLKTAGDNTGTTRSLQVGDVFTISVYAKAAYGQMGFSLNATASTGSWDNRYSNSRLYIQADGLTGSWYVNHNGGSSTLNYNVSTTGHTYQFKVFITSLSTCNVEFYVDGGFHSRLMNLTLKGTAGANIDGFSLYLNDDWNGSSNSDIYWKQTTAHEALGIVNLGYWMESGTFAPGLVQDGLESNSTSNSFSNNVFVGGDVGSVVIFNQPNTYTGTTTVNTNATLELQGSIASSAVTVQSGATLKINGTDVTVNSLTVESGGVVNIEPGKSLTVTGAFSNIGTVTIKSDANGTGSLITNGTVSGNVTAQRYIPGYSKGTTGFHLLSSPVSSQNISTEFVDVDNIPTTTDFYYFNEVHNYWINIKNDLGAYNQGDTWENFSPLANPQFVVGKGYLVGYSTAPDPVKEFTGTPNTGNLASGTGIPTITYTEGEGNGWNLVGNPYPSAIDWDHADWVKTNINASVYVYDGSSGNYVSWNGSTGGLTDGVIPAMQGFFIKADAASPALTIPNNARVHSTSNIYKSSTRKDADNILVLQCESQGLSDKLYLQFSSEATENYDGQFDAYKLMGTGNSPQIYSNSTDGKLLSINALPVVNEELLIPVNVKVILPGIHTISLPVNTLLVGQNLLLEDKKEQITVKFSTEESYSFLAEENDNPDRFTLHFGVTGLSDNTALATLRAYVSHGQLTILGETGELNVDVLDMQGRVLERRAVQMDGSYSQPLNLPAGVYVVRVYNGQTAKSIKVILTNR